jgi:DNA-binding LacI/PurR family transcriptional regulator
MRLRRPAATTMPTLEHQPISARRPHRSDGSRKIGLFSLDPTSYAKTSALLGIHRATTDSEQFVSVVSVPVSDHASLRTVVKRLRRLAVEGILVVAPQRGEIDTLAELAVDVPVVVVAAGPQERLPAVAIDHYSGAIAATSHLLELGHRTVFHIAGPADREDPGPRLAGWRDTLMAAGADIPTPMAGDWSAEAGYELGRRLALRRDVTAVFAASDQMALGVMHALFEAGRRVPQDVSVVGFDGSPHGEFFNPPLTTVRQNYTEMGRRSLQLLLSEIEVSSNATIHETIPAELIVRASTAAAA